MINKFELYHSTHYWFAKNPEIYNGNRHQAFLSIAAKISEVLDVERVGIWFIDEKRESFIEELTYAKGQPRPSSGQILHKDNYPIYFNYLIQARALASEDTLNDEVTSEFVESYMKVFDVKSLIDSPIFSDGKLIGIICCEKTGTKRSWDIHDMNFVGSCSEVVGRVVESEKRHIYETVLQHRIEYLENDLKRRLDDLNEAKISLDMALEGAQVGKWDWDIPNNKLILNRTWFTKLGYEPDELPQSIDTFQNAVHEDDKERVNQEIDQHLKNKSPFYEARYRMYTKTGEVQWCLDRGCVVSRDSEGHPLKMIGVNINITPVIKLEQSLIASEQQLKSMIRSLPTPVAMFDKNYDYLAFSAKWEQEWNQYGKVEEGSELAVGGFEAFKAAWISKMEEAFAGNTISQDEDLIEITPDIQVWVRWIIQPWKNSNGHIGGVVVMAENITHRKEAEMRLAQASKLSALGEMAGGIAHEINNPLSIIKGYIDLLKRHSQRHSLNEELMLQYIEKMDSTVARISRIVNGMRRFSRESSMDEKVEYSLNKIIEETLDICQERINNNGTAVNVEYFPDSPMVLCRPVEISQVILNLINNAYQAISSFDHPWINIKCREHGGNYRICITDSGAGIPHMVRQKLFQPFFTTKDIGVGTGLGLSISRGIIEEHRGRLYYQEDAPNTTFVVEIPKLKKEEHHVSP